MTTDSDPRAGRFALAKRLGRDAGGMALDYFRDRSSLTIDNKRNAHDIVSIADREIERMLRARIAAAFPDDGIWGEEFGRQPGTSGFEWVVDPIDGTSPFVFGMPSWCVSIAVMEGDRTFAGTVFAPVTDELFAAERGGGAFLNDGPLRLGADATLANGLIGAGASHRAPPDIAPRFIERLLRAEGMFIRNGSGALMLAYVAAGRLAGYYEPHINAYDCLAGLLLVEEAGGWIHDPRLWESLEAGGLAVAASPSVRDDLLALIDEDVRPRP
ncbi:inositol monophosphatase family protein [Marinivivus vitaminiproducens]|uniref:inositol monophosphatase family protein n=1 Tax=Marinivivus vitaminiproducens TaxID=3035935 RepID=UPI0027A756FA|nr:inositol monophosphatase [Geminicoccaceae bacterium SCSIO 64248]